MLYDAMKLSASILSADPLAYGEAVEQIAPLVDEIHLDVLDGCFAPPISFGAHLSRALSARFPTIALDAHLMVNDPASQWESFLSAGSQSITFHYEVSHRAYSLLASIRSANARAGIAINPATPVDTLLPLAGCFDRLLIMTVEPGYGGQKIIPQCVAKIKRARELFGLDLEIAVDGGVNDKSIKDLARAGANVFVVGSYLVGANISSQRQKERVALLRRLSRLLSD